MPTPHPLPGWVAATIVAAELSIVAVLPRAGEDAGDGDTVAKLGLQLTQDVFFMHLFIVLFMLFSLAYLNLYNNIGFDNGLIYVVIAIPLLTLSIAFGLASKRMGRRLKESVSELIASGTRPRRTSAATSAGVHCLVRGWRRASLSARPPGLGHRGVTSGPVRSPARSRRAARRTSADRAELLRRNQVRLALLPPDLYPRVVEAAAPMTACTAEDQEFHYRFGIDLFVAGVQAMAARSKLREQS